MKIALLMLDVPGEEVPDSALSVLSEIGYLFIQKDEEQDDDLQEADDLEDEDDE